MNARGRVYAYLTGERVTPESAEHGDAEERGWVDPGWSKREFFDSRNDVRPVLAEWIEHDNLPDVLRPAEPLEDIVRDVLEEHLGAYEDNGDGTFYGVDAVDNWTGEDLERGYSYTYAIHFYIKEGGSSERAWHPSELEGWQS